METVEAAPEDHRILDVVSQSKMPVMVIEVPSEVITAASPGAHELLDEIGRPLIGRSLNDLTEGHPSGAMPLLAAGRIIGYETLRVLKLTGQRRRLWIRSLPSTGSAKLAIAVLLKEDTAGRVFVPWLDDDASSTVIGSTDSRLVIDRVSSEVFESLGYRPREITGTSFLALVVSEDVAEVLSALAQTSEHSEGVTLRVGIVGADLVPVTCQLVLLSLKPEPSCAFALLAEESDGEPADPDAVAELITRLGRGIRGAMTSQAVASAPLRPDVDLGRLSSRELEVVSRLVTGSRVASIAESLFLSEGTIRNHLSSVFGKLEVRTQRDLIELLRPVPAAHLEN
ncbi:MAG: Response regulator containing a CheY-like receiver domain and an DNA-binding domain [Frankiales bacterium]|nr:Response regulator containing a CheY-like receiver domain and an DNA-binding domain [Frankiales bacterium]